jgi:hypothetical protein
MGSCAIKQRKNNLELKRPSIVDTKCIFEIYKPYRAHEVRRQIFSAKDAKVPRLDLHINLLYMKRISKNC